VDRTGRPLSLDRAALGFTYRHTAVPEEVIFTGAVLQGRRGDRLEIARRIAEIDRQRDESQPRSRTGGSTFVNPPGARAWELIDLAGCRGLRIGGAEVSDKHCNFLINTGEASAHDIETLGEEVRRRVWERTGVRLQWEIRRIGEPAPGRGLPASGVPL
jgi:UDP-N-acetylmuramate dehydrogenase